MGKTSVKTMRPRSPWLPRPVWLLGWISLGTDTASEAIYPLLPLFLTHVLGAGAVSLGVIEGVAEAANSVLKVIAGGLSDRWGRRRPIVMAGYGLSSAMRPLIALVGAWPQVLGLRFLDRVGKGIRGAPRDALLATYAPAEARGRVFGFHRSMDHMGAILGPLLAALFLWFHPGEYRTLFALTVIPGLVVVWLLLRLPPDPVAEAHEGGGDPGGLAARPTPPEVPANWWTRLPRRYYLALGVMVLFALGNSADAFLLLRLTDLGVSAFLVPVLWAGLHVVKASTSVMGGALSDRWGRRPVIAVGWMVYAAVYAGFALTVSLSAVVGCFLVYGLYFGMVEGVEKALVADFSPAELRGTAFGLYNASLGVGALLASVVFGVIWQNWGAPAAFAVGASLAVGATVLLLLLVREERDQHAW